MGGRDEDWAGCGTETLLRLVDLDGRESDFTWFHADSRKSIANFAKECSAFAAALTQSRRSTPDQPWQMILYTDEIVPGNPLAPANSRKVWAWYMTFLEFGPSRVCNCAYWHPIGCIRNSIVEKVRGGLSAVYRVLVRECFLGHESFSTGVLIEPRGAEPFLLFAELSHLIADEAALKKRKVCQRRFGLGVVFVV